MARDDEEHRLDELLASLASPPDDELAAASARARSRRRWSHQLAAESSTLAGVLLTLAERGDPVTVRCGGWSHRGRLRTVTAPLIVVERADGLALLATDSITTVEADGAVTDDRALAGGPDLATALAALAAERPAVRLQLVGGEELVGALTGLGNDVATVRLPTSVVTARLSAITGCVVLLARGNDDRAAPSQGASADALPSPEDLGSG